MKHNRIKAVALARFVPFALVAIGAGIVRTSATADNGKKWIAPASASAKKNPIAATPISIKEGKNIFEKECAQCHGKSGKGDGPKAGDLTTAPRDLTSREVQSQTDGAIFWKITTGQKPMPTFRTAYSDEDRWNIVNYLRTFKK